MVGCFATEVGDFAPIFFDVSDEKEETFDAGRSCLDEPLDRGHCGGEGDLVGSGGGAPPASTHACVAKDMRHARTSHAR